MAIEKAKIEARNLEPQHVFLASFLAGLNEMGMLNQASVNVASRRAGQYLADYAKAIGTVPAAGSTKVESAKLFVEHLDTIMKLGTQLQTVEENGLVVVKVLSKGCRFCPKGVGEAALEGTLCPYPALIKEFVNQLLPEGQKLKLAMQGRRPLHKEGDNCEIALV